MAFFGYPEAHDNDAERAARAGLAILEAIAKLNQQPERPKLAARIGIDSGTVVVGVGAGKVSDLFGDAPNIAAQVQESAAPGTVRVTGDTHRLVSGLFVVEARGAPALKGNPAAGSSSARWVNERTSAGRCSGIAPPRERQARRHPADLQAAAAC